MIEYSDNYSDTSESLWQFERDEIADNANVTVANSSSLKYKSSFVGNTDNYGVLNGIKVAVSLKYLSNFWRSFEMKLTNFKIVLSLTWIEHCVLTASINIENNSIANAVRATFKIKDAKFYVPIVTLSTEDNVKLKKLLSEDPKISVYWKKYKLIPNKNEVFTNDNPKNITQLLDAGDQGVKRLFVLAYNNSKDNNRVSVNYLKKDFLLKVKIENCNIEIDGRNFYD